MYTQCPECLTVFEINEDALQAALGTVECGHCGNRFNALFSLSDRLPHAKDGPVHRRPPEEAAPVLTRAVAGDQSAASVDPQAETGAADPEDWLGALPDDRATALIADAAGIPPEEACDAETWQVTDAAAEADTDTGDGDAAGRTPDDPGQWHDADGTPMQHGGVGALHGDAKVVDTDLDDAAGSAAAALDVEPSAVDIDVPVTPPLPSDTRDMASEYTASESAAPDALGADDREVEPGERAAAEAGATPIDDADESSETGAADDAMADTAPDGPAPAAAPVYVRPRHSRITRINAALWLGCVLLAALLAVQLAWAHRVDLFRDPDTRPWVASVCMRIDCRMPPIRDTARLELLSRDIRPDPAKAGALVITATLRNDARFRQPWPIVVVSLMDLDNQIVAMRRFRPTDYMPDAARRAAGIGPGATAAVAFEVVDPGKRAVAFHFGFE